MAKDYGQFCGLAKAGSVLGERWSLLLVRDLSVAPRRFKELHEGLPGIPTSVLTSRLRDLQAMGVVSRVADEQPGGGVLYALTPHGAALEPILDALGRWGASTMAVPASGDVITDASMAAALRAGFQPGIIEELTTFAVHAGPSAAWARAMPDGLVVGTGQPEAPSDLVIHAGPELRLLLAGRLTPADALATGVVQIEGPLEAFKLFARAFHVPLEDGVAAG